MTDQTEIIMELQRLANETIAKRDARIAELEAALKPFVVDSLMDNAPTLADYRAARAAMEGKDDV